MLVLLDQRAGRFHRAFDDRGQLDRFPVQVDLAPRDSRNIHQIVNQSGQELRLSIHHVSGHLKQPRFGGRRLENLHGVADGRQWIP